MTGIFLNYRRDDTSGHAGRLYDRLVSRFGRGRVFLDINIEPGVDFEETIRRQVDLCDAFIVVIGSHWRTIADRSGRSRLENPRDWTRIELEIALERGIPIVPVLVQGAMMPTEEELPTSLRRLATRNALELSDNRWDYDIGRLFQLLTKWVQPDADGARSDHEADDHAAGDLRDHAPDRRPRVSQWGIGRIDWPEFAMSAAIAFTWFWVVPKWAGESWDDASGRAAEVLAVALPAFICGYGTTFGILLPVFKALVGIPKKLLTWVPIVGAVSFAIPVIAAEIVEPESAGRFGAAFSGAVALLLCNLGPIVAEHLRSHKWSLSQLAVRVLVASAAFTLGARILRFYPDAAVLGGLLYNGIAVAPLPFAAFAGLSAYRAGQLGDLQRSWVIVPLVAGGLLLGHGGVRGKVMDVSGGVLPGVSVEYGRCSSATDESGLFTVGNVCLPLYGQFLAPADIQFTLPGFTTSRVKTIAVPGVNRHLDVSMNVGVAEQVSVTVSPFSLATILMLPLAALPILLPVSWLLRRKQVMRDLVSRLP
jgi:hypothetical protein